MTREQIENSLKKYNRFLAATTAWEKRDHDGKRWRVGHLANDGYNGMAGGRYFHNLADVEEHITRDLAELYDRLSA